MSINNPKIYLRLWAAVSSDFESLMAKFMSRKGWRYVHFARICREMKITLVLNITQGRGKNKDEHYDKVTDLILQMCKELWLRVGSVVQGVDDTEVDPSLQLKRSLGGFYLLYTMYEKQPIRDRVKIAFGISDLELFQTFLAAIDQFPFKLEIMFMLNHLNIKNAFKYCIYPEEFGFDATTRYFLNNSRSDVVDLTKRMRDNQDVLAYSSTHTFCEEEFKKMGISKNLVAKDLMKTVQPNMLARHMQGDSAFPIFIKALPTDSLYPALQKFEKLVDTPLVTLQSLTATDAIERRMAMETRRRMERARKKAVLASGRGAEHKASNPYVREGGIFGRKKETDENYDKGKRRERGACTGNLWIYINGQDFDKAPGRSSEDLPDSATNDVDNDEMEMGDENE